MNNRKMKKNNNLINRTKRLSNVAIAGLIFMTIFKILMINIGGDSSITYFSVAFELYFFTTASLCASIAYTVERMTASRISKGSFKNVSTLRRTATIISAILGLIIGSLVYLCSNQISVFFLHSTMSAFSIRISAFCIFLAFLSAPIYGYFQGLGTMMPSAFYYLIQRVITVVVGIPLLIFYYRYGLKVSKLMNQEEYSAAYAGMGGFIALLSGLAAGFLFLFFVFGSHNRQFKHQLTKEVMETKESWQRLGKGLLQSILSTGLQGLFITSFLLIELYIFVTNMSNSLPQTAVFTQWGNLYGRVLSLVVLAAVAVSSGRKVLETELQHQFGRVDNRILKDKIHKHFQIVVMMSLPWVIFFGLAAEAILSTIFNGNLETAVILLRIGSIGVLLLAIAMLQYSVMTGIKKNRVFIIYFLISTCVHHVVMIVLFRFTGMQIEAVMISEVMMLFVFNILNQLTIRKYFKMKREPGNYILVSFTSCVATGILLFLVNQLLKPVIGDIITFILSLIIAWVCYFVLLITYKALDKRILDMLPLGKQIYKVAISLHLMREES